MPVNIIVGLFALLVALALYTVGVWAAFRSKRVKSWHLLVLWVGVAFDVLATAMMAVQIGGLGRDLHTVLALLAWAGLVAAAGVGTWALTMSHDRMSAMVARWAVAPWALWVVVFVYGMADRGAHRLVTK
jgi:hypothetical protein